MYNVQRTMIRLGNPKLLFPIGLSAMKNPTEVGTLNTCIFQTFLSSFLSNGCSNLDS
jgi:hypothetical protein